MLAPKMIPTLFRKESNPPFTSPTAMTDVAELDWMTAVTTAPMTRPMIGILVALARNLRNRSPVTCSISLEKFSKPKTKRMMAVRPAIRTWRFSTIAAFPLDRLGPVGNPGAIAHPEV